MSLHSTCLPVAHEDEDLCLFTYSINSCIRPLALSCKRLCFISGMNVINDLCICVLHLKLWMLAMIQGLALQSQGSFFLYKGGILQMVSEHYVACRILTLGLETTKEKFSTTSTLVLNFSNLLSHLYL